VAALAGTTALLCAALAGWLAWHHPLSRVAVLLACAVLFGLTAWRPQRWPLWLLALWPWVGGMPWTGWLVVEEFDLVVLAVAAGGYLRWAVDGPVPAGRAPGQGAQPSIVPLLLVLSPLALSTLWALQRGVADAGGLSWGWWQGYREPLNSVRLAKPLFEVLLLLPLWRYASQHDERSARDALVHGIVLLLMGVAAVVWWERLAFTGLLDFATDYRATGPFWEMHVGGAALDAALAIAVPVAVAALVATQMRGLWGVMAAVTLGLALYAALVTFSRIVYGAVPLGLLVWWVLQWRQGSALLPGLQSATLGDASSRVAASAWWLLWLLGFAGLAWLTFPTSGYRGLLALAGTVALLLPLVPLLRPLPAATRVLGLGLGVLGAAAVALVMWVLPKGAYVAYAIAWGATAAGVWWQMQAPASASVLASAPAPRAVESPTSSLLALLTLASYVATVAAGVAVAWHWGGDPAWPAALALAVLLLAVLLLASVRAVPPWPASWQWQTPLMGALLAVAALVGVFSGGGYMGGRMAASTQDSQDRRAHWGRALGMLSSTDWAIGKGLGRYWANQSLSGLASDQTGDYRLLTSDEGAAAVLLTSGRHELGSGEALRLSQRVWDVPAPGPLTLQLRLRIDKAVKLQAEVCEKHLLYPAGCVGVEQRVDVPPASALAPASAPASASASASAAGAAPVGQWHSVTLKLKGDNLGRGPGLVPRSLVFSISLGNHLNRAEIDQLSLTDSLGRELLSNGGFEGGLARWYFSSDRYHMPWHAKNMAVHLLFEQGLLGLGAWVIVVGLALWRVALGAARDHPLAPSLAAALVGMLAVGMIDSLLDMSRVAFLILWLLVVALGLRPFVYRPGQVH
jgi:uncharacterized integral membrane protein